MIFGMASGKKQACRFKVFT